VSRLPHQEASINPRYNDVTISPLSELNFSSESTSPKTYTCQKQLPPIILDCLNFITYLHNICVVT